MAESILRLGQRPPNDEPVFDDFLGHHCLAKEIGDQIIECTPPFVVGVQGSWGSGKTSFLRKVWAYLGGGSDCQDTDLKRWFGEGWGVQDDVRAVWFNPWQHQFEDNPIVALLQEIRNHFAWDAKLREESRKIASVAVYSGLSMLGELSSLLPKIRVKDIVEKGREYEADHFSTVLSSQRFRDLFEGAITQIAGPRGRLVVFIDDLDRCEGAIAYRLLESLKLFLNAQNCVYILGLDQKHLENAIAHELSSEESARYRPLAREYLGKMFQCQFLLPVTRDMRPFIESILRFDDDAVFSSLISERFGVDRSARIELIKSLNECLPHNPRKVKAFVAAWKVYLSLLAQQGKGSLDWRITIVLNYLAQFEEPLYRKVEEAPGFLQDHIYRFCKVGQSTYRSGSLFDGLELPYESPVTSEGFALPNSPSSLLDDMEKKDLPSPSNRAFCISPLIKQLGDSVSLNREKVEMHLLRATHSV